MTAGRVPMRTRQRWPLRACSRSPDDNEILRLAALALGALAAEPLYILVDTAIVGHLGRAQLAALGIAGLVLANLFANFNFLTYGTTAQVGRAEGAGAGEIANRLGAQATWLSLALGSGVAVGVFLLAEPIVAVLGADGAAGAYATTYLRIAALGLPFAFLALSGQGYLRGVGDLRAPLVIVLGANAVNVVLEVAFVYGFDWGIAGSAWGTVIAQAAMGVAFAWRVFSAAGLSRFDPVLVRRLLGVGRHIFVRTSALHAALIVAGAVIARFGEASIAAHQITFALWVLLAYALDSLAIAGQVIVGRRLGAGSAVAAYAAAQRLLRLSVLVGALFAGAVLALTNLLPMVFSGDAAIIEQTRSIWLLLAVALPLSAVVYALDGILLGAGDVRYLMWAMLASAATAVTLSLVALERDWGLVGVWLALLAMNTVRLLTLVVRFRRRRWLVTGWA